MLAKLPIELTAQIVAAPVLAPADLARAAQVCRAWHAVAAAEPIWRALALRLGLVPTSAERRGLCAAVHADDLVLAEAVPPVVSSWRAWVLLQLSLARQWGREPRDAAGLPAPARPFPFPLVRATIPTRGHAPQAARSSGATSPTGADSGFVLVPEQQILVVYNTTLGLWALDIASHERRWSAPCSAGQMVHRLAAARGVVVALTSFPSERVDGHRLFRIQMYTTSHAASSLGLGQPVPIGQLAHWADVPIPFPKAAMQPEDTGPKIRFHYPIVAYVEHRLAPPRHSMR